MHSAVGGGSLKGDNDNNNSSNNQLYVKFSKKQTI